MDAADRELLLVRATVHLQGLPIGKTARVDPSDPYIAECLEATWLVPVGAPRTSPVRESPGGAAETLQSDDPVGG